ncbi:AIPR family protein [Methylobacterium sp. WL120]|uniref:AIPR family protein n=1 Tax=Methylobacterium sp. WL120 TaxID=2603887 RepID=UPI0011C6FB9A|nr:AIPR family protein [Methylobacterium sp. WL120]TXM70870.1 AIPR family protein [Methylobacterium sp. WL120]
MTANPLNVQVVDQRVMKKAHDLEEKLKIEIGIKNDPHKLKSAAFVCVVAGVALGLTDEEVLDGVVEGGSDFGVDALYRTTPVEGEFRVTLVQGKYKQNLEGDANFPETGVTKLIEAIKILFNPNSAFTANDRLRKRIEEIRSFIAEGDYPKIRAILCNNGIKWNNEAQQRIEAAGFRDLVEWEHIGPDELRHLMRAKVAVEAQLQLSGKAIVEDHPFMRAMIGRMSVIELANLFKKHGDALLERNIRRYLGLSGRVNEEIAATLRDNQQRPRFYFYNNGVTIICNKFGYNGFADRDYLVNLKSVQIVNGGQTSRTILHMLDEIGPEIASAHVLVRIYELPDDDEDLVQKITRATNNQNPVDLKDLKSNDLIQKNLEEMISSLGYTYRRKRADGVSATEITNTTVAEAVLAIWRQRPHQARFMTTEHFGKLYEQIFTVGLNGTQAIISVLILRIAENKRKRPPEGSPDYLQYGSRFIAMLMGIYLLNDLGVDLGQLNHLKFQQARSILEEKGEIYFQRALVQLGKAIKNLCGDQEQSLQKLSATFRRGDLVAELIGRELAVDA